MNDDRRSFLEKINRGIIYRDWVLSDVNLRSLKASNMRATELFLSLLSDRHFKQLKQYGRINIPGKLLSENVTKAYPLGSPSITGVLLGTWTIIPCINRGSGLMFTAVGSTAFMILCADLYLEGCPSWDNYYPSMDRSAALYMRITNGVPFTVNLVQRMQMFSFSLIEREIEKFTHASDLWAMTDEAEECRRTGVELIELS
jgi:hypothetical protein